MGHVKQRTACGCGLRWSDRGLAQGAEHMEARRRDEGWKSRGGVTQVDAETRLDSYDQRALVQVEDDDRIDAAWSHFASASCFLALAG
eukprot:2875215-Rhodomonas_salina.2